MTGLHVAALLRLLSVAEEELEGCTVPGVFAALRPPVGFVAMDPAIYRAHARELIQRAERGEDLRLGTRAEVLVSFHRASLRFPLNRGGQAAYELLFSEVFPGHLATLTPEEWRGQAEESIQEIRRKIQSDDRRLPKPSPA